MSSRTAKFAPTTASSAPLIGAAPSEARNDAAYSIALFRILFGSILLRFFWDLFNSSWISDQFENAQYLPAYNWTEGIIFTAFSIRFSLVVLLVASVCFVIGLFYRLNCFILLVFYSYIYLANPTWATSSKYLIWVLIVLFSFTNAHTVASIDARFFGWLKVAEMKTPKVHLMAFKIIFTLVPLYSGFAKWMSADWMERAEPLSTLLLFGSVSTSYPAWAFLSGPSFGYTPSALADIGFIVSYAIIYIEIVGTVALWGPQILRWFGLFATALLALLHSSIAQGLYPYIIICSFCLWLSPSRSKSILQALHMVKTAPETLASPQTPAPTPSHLTPSFKPNTTPKIIPKPKKPAPSTGATNIVSNFFFHQLPLVLLYIFLLQQIITPALPYLSSHEPSWAAHANSISWRMMLQTQDTLVQWHSFTLASSSSKQPVFESAIVAQHDGDDTWSTKAVDPDTWLSIRNSAALLHQWSVRRVLPALEQKYGSDMVPISAYRSVNGRPYQPWIRLERSDLKKWRCSKWFGGCEDLIEPQIKEYNSLEWLLQKQIRTDEWIQRGFESVFFAQRSGGIEFGFKFKPFSQRLYLVLLGGEIEVASYAGFSSKPLKGEQLPIDFGVYHEVRTISKEPAAWAFIWPWPRNMTLSGALGQ